MLRQTSIAFGNTVPNFSPNDRKSFYDDFLNSNLVYMIGNSPFFFLSDDFLNSNLVYMIGFYLLFA